MIAQLLDYLRYRLTLAYRNPARHRAELLAKMRSALITVHDPARHAELLAQIEEVKSWNN